MTFDLRNLPDGFIDNPHPHYAALRETDPVYEMPGGGLFLSRHADLVRVYKDRETFSSDKRVEFYPKFGDSLLYQHHTTSLVFNDAPLHTRVRRAIAGALAPRAIAGMEMPWLAGETLFVLSLDGRLYAIRRNDGAIRWIAELPGALPFGSVVAEDIPRYVGPVVAGGKVITIVLV